MIVFVFTQPKSKRALTYIFYAIISMLNCSFIQLFILFIFASHISILLQCVLLFIEKLLSPDREPLIQVQFIEFRQFIIRNIVSVDGYAIAMYIILNQQKKSESICETHRVCVTVFICNDKQTNRFKSNSQMS